MTSMIERVARAIGGEENGTPVDEHGERWRNWEPAARAAIAAMREPTEGMVSAGNKSRPFNVVGYCEGTVHPVCQRSWPAMIDAALEEKP